MSEPYGGGCACGAIRYEISGEPVFQNECQCRDCQHRSGAGHGSYMTFADRKAVTLSGEASHWDVTADNGNVKTNGFCPRCGSPVYMTFSRAPDLFNVTVGSLDDPGRFMPQAVTYAVRAHGWDHIDPALVRFAKMPA